MMRMMLALPGMVLLLMTTTRRLSSRRERAYKHNGARAHMYGLYEHRLNRHLTAQDAGHTLSASGLALAVSECALN